MEEISVVVVGQALSVLDGFQELSPSEGPQADTRRGRRSVERGSERCIFKCGWRFEEWDGEVVEAKRRLDFLLGG